MNWYLAKIVFEIICGDGNHTPQFDEQLRLIEAGSAAEAFDRAIEIGESENDEFTNESRKLVQWKFINVSELLRLSELVNGVELYSKVQEADNARLYRELIHKKAAHIRENIELQFLQIY